MFSKDLLAASSTSTIRDERYRLAACQHLDPIVSDGQLYKGYSIAAMRYCPRSDSHSWEVRLRNARSRMAIRNFTSHYDAMKPWIKKLGNPVNGDGIVIDWEDFWICADRILTREFLKF